eukprot:CAMPEP_0183293736 /NCGR_PEP_ID=MMETSP0160_2-20130417/2314_1 /TAXON_ID=2839 ORGANISM="Odontella Sinensis, Strain Grunow 1884" /NCGR_SAMPLE_ID=MMETSP0160_2 /ASSEMBLY_ACC=CAM_ASM_000250 /LENGTH=203 /DNA_ID=CAMNT_0025454905 /DNA_START=70 /DNA_END=681 /DNA_ORIENTATION=+
MSARNRALEMWKSKLGGQYPKHQVEADHDRNMAILARLRNEPANRLCADCGREGTVWSSVNLGVFTCLRCGSLHRALGTHVSKPKGCTGTYLWGLDEITRMKEIGNANAVTLYGGVSERPKPNANDNIWLEYLRDKYERRKFEAAISPGKTDAILGSDARGKEGSWAQLDVNTSVTTEEDLLGLNAPLPVQDQKGDFFAQFGL